MNFKFAKTLLMGSMLSFGLMACGDDSSTSPSSSTPSAGDPIEVPTQKDASIKFNNPASVAVGDFMKFTGSVSFDFSADTSANYKGLLFTGISFKVGQVDGTALKNVLVEPTITKPTTFPTDRNLTLNEMGVMVDLKATGFTACGPHALLVTVTANDGVKDYESTEQIAFTRADSYCKTAETPVTPVAKEEITMVSAIVPNLSTEIAPGFTFSTGVAGATGDVIFSKAAGKELSMTSTTGYKFATITGDYTADAGYWPEEFNSRDAYLSDFSFRALKETMSDLVSNSNQIYVAAAPNYDKTTGAGIYAFALTNLVEGNNGNFTFSIKYYKVK